MCYIVQWNNILDLMSDSSASVLTPVGPQPNSPSVKWRRSILFISDRSANFLVGRWIVIQLHHFMFFVEFLAEWKQFTRASKDFPSMLGWQFGLFGELPGSRLARLIQDRAEGITSSPWWWKVWGMSRISKEDVRRWWSGWPPRSLDHSLTHSLAPLPAGK